MMKETQAIVIKVTKQWWLKINTKPIRMHSFDGAIFPHVIKVLYQVDGKTYYKSKGVGASKVPPSVNSKVSVIYDENKPKKAKIIL